MDPRHPELAIDRIDELMKQYKAVLAKMRVCQLSSKLGGLEREGGLIVQEICMVAPRLHEAMVQVSRTRRSAIAHGLVEIKPEPEITSEGALAVIETAKKNAGDTDVLTTENPELSSVEDAPALEPVVELPAEPVEQPEEVVSEMETPTAIEEPSATSSKTEQVEPAKEEKPKQTTKQKTTKKADK